MPEEVLGGPQFHYRRTLEEARDDVEGAVGIALSGGGVRAACLGLGALQRAEELGILQRAKYVSAVSGGSYIASAFLAARAVEGTQESGVRAWQRGSFEEAHLRRNLRYLAEDWPDQVLALTSYLTRTAVHLAQFVAGLVLVGSGLGLLYRWLGWLVADGSVLSAGHSVARYSTAVLLLVLGAYVDHGSRSARPSELMTLLYIHRRNIRLFVMFLIAILVVPDLVAFGTEIFNQRRLKPMSIGTPAAATIVGAVLIGAIVLRTQSTLPSGRIREFAGMALRAVFSIVVLAIFALPPLMLISQQSGKPASDVLIWFGTSFIVLFFCGVFVHANMTSLHSTYSRRLARAYIVQGQDHHDPSARTGGADVLHRRLDSVYLSDLDKPGVPELLVCAAVNVGAGESAQGEGCTSFVFSHEFCGMPDGRIDFAPSLKERSCAELVAASGAAIAPNMGRLTRKSVRALLALVNLRLGLWIQTPRAAEMLIDNADSPPGQRSSRSLVGRLVDGWREPGPLWTWREAFGAVSAHYDALFISDGGHWDNSGIIELMRRRCQTIFAVDAAVDEDRLANLLRAISLARTELGVEIVATGALLHSKEPVRRLRFSYDGEDPTHPTNQLILMRTHIAEAEMPADLVALSHMGGHGTSVFPRHVTVNQFLLARDVDGYIALGRWLFEEGAEKADLRPAEH